jgi:hypothetical protein
MKKGDLGFCSIVDAYEKAMMTDAKFVVGVQEPEALWCDAGTCEVYRELNSEPMSPSLFCNAKLDALVSGIGWKDDETLAEYLGARGSDRMFYKLMRGFSEDATNSTPPILGVVYEEARKENANARFANITRFLESKGVRVPKMLVDLPESKAYATEFVEGKSLEVAANEKGADLIKLYMPVLDVLKQYDAFSYTTIQSFNDSVLEKLYSLDPTLKLEKLVIAKLIGLPIIFDGSLTYFSTEKYHYIRSFNFFYRALSPSLSNYLHKEGYKIRIWTINDPGSLPDIKLDGIITDHPELF